MKTRVMTLVFMACASMMPQQVRADAMLPETLTDAECSKDILLSYFPEPFVRQTLQKFNVPKDKWDAIVKELAEKNKIVMKNVEEKASKLSVSLLKDPQQRQAAVKLFRETVLEIFTGVMKNNGITDEKQIQSMLDDIQQQTARRFAACIKQSQTTAKVVDNSNSNDDDDGSDYDDGDDDGDDSDDDSDDAEEDDKSDNKDESDKQKEEPKLEVNVDQVPAK